MKLGTTKLINSQFSTIYEKLFVYFTNSYVLLGVFLYGISALVWVLAIARLPLSVAYPMVALGYVLVCISSAFLFHEGFNMYKFAGIILIIAGVLCISRS
ncbi:SMR family transporter [Paenibacillus sp. USDA918EY]|uniref:SMR family transporter n=1 Tax=Paenibacillus sp. USDA918EY TaxID=2689575 RepID=UPI001F1EC110|nr:SMR family transporter [Paenibacillus sp. USDA918EY]